MIFNTAVTLLDWFGVIVFAVSGALVASRKQMDIVGFALLGIVTGIGGGSLRDILLGELPVFWVREPAYLTACATVSVVVFLTAHIPQSRYRLLLWFDAVGLSIFAITGAERALLAGSGPVIAVAMGVITATFGGIVRDVLGAESPVVLSREVYVTAALLGAMVFVGGSLLLPREVAIGGVSRPGSSCGERPFIGGGRSRATRRATHVAWKNGSNEALLGSDRELLTGSPATPSAALV